MQITKNMRKSLFRLTKTIRDAGMAALTPLIEKIATVGWGRAFEDASAEQAREIKKLLQQQNTGPGRRTAVSMARQIARKSKAHEERLKRGRWAPATCIDPAMSPEMVAAFKARATKRWERYHRSRSQGGGSVMVHDAPRHIREGIGLR